MRGLLIGEDEAVAAWAFKTFNLYPSQVNRALGVIEDDGRLTGAILLQCFNGCNIEISYYGVGVLTPGIIRAVARTVHAEFKVSRATVVTSKRRRKLIKQLMRLGFGIEGAQRCYYGPHDNVRNTGIRMVMFRDRIQKLAYPDAERLAARI